LISVLLFGGFVLNLLLINLVSSLFKYQCGISDDELAS